MLASRLAAFDCAEALDVGVLAAERLHLAHAGDALLQVGVDVADLRRACGGTPCAPGRRTSTVATTMSGTTAMLISA